MKCGFFSLLFIFLRVATLHTQQNKWAEIKLYLVLLKFDEFISLTQVVVVIAARSSRPINNIPTTHFKAASWRLINDFSLNIFSRVKKMCNLWWKVAIYSKSYRFSSQFIWYNGISRARAKLILRPLVGRFTSRLWPAEDFWSFWMCWPLDQITMQSKIFWAELIAN